MLAIVLLPLLFVTLIFVKSVLQIQTAMTLPSLTAKLKQASALTVPWALSALIRLLYAIKIYAPDAHKIHNVMAVLYASVTPRLVLALNV